MLKLNNEIFLKWECQPERKTASREKLLISAFFLIISAFFEKEFKHHTE